MDSLEDGEIPDSDEELSAIEKSKVCIQRNDVSSSSTPPANTGRNLSCDIHNYRQNKTNGPGYSSSEHSDDSDEEDVGLWKKKRVRYCEKQADKHSRMLVSEDRFFDEKPFVNPNICADEKKDKKKKINNIWGSVLQEQTLTKEMKDVGVEKPEAFLENERDVETYNYKMAHNDDRPDNPEGRLEEDEEGPFTGVCDPEDDLRIRKNLKRKKGAKHRIGKRTFDANKDRSHIKATEDDCEAIVVSSICATLEEPKVDLITRVVNIIGKKKSLELLYMTEDVESAGGMMINNGDRRRTPGGVYLQLLKSDDHITRAQIDEIFAEENRIWKEKMKDQRKMKKKKWKNKHRKSVKDGEMECEGHSDESDNSTGDMNCAAEDSESLRKSPSCDNSYDLGLADTDDIIIE